MSLATLRTQGALDEFARRFDAAQAQRLVAQAGVPVRAQPPVYLPNPLAWWLQIVERVESGELGSVDEVTAVLTAAYEDPSFQPGA
ncbi:MAG: hypothetical protein KC636_24485 [Myxococcales bacterium]|nr:hypothetical protein [Myxococcales bacterium]